MEYPAQLQSITTAMSEQGMIEMVLKNAKKNYVFSQKDFKGLNSHSVLQHFSTKKVLENKVEASEKSQIEEPTTNSFQILWHPNEFKFFVWISVCYAHIEKREIPNFTNQDVLFLHQCFPLKKLVFIQYNLRCLLKQDRSTRQGWYQQEINLLTQIINSDNLKGKWTDISFAMYQRSGKKFFRSSHKCREKWFNHLDPSVAHSKWSVSEDYRLFRLISEMGTKWASISKSMNGSRTQHMVKNRYNSLYKKYSIKYQRYAPKKLIDIIIKDLKKRIQNQPKQIHIDKQQNLMKAEEEQSTPTNQQGKMEEPKSECTETTMKSNDIKIQDYFSTCLLLPQWESFEFQEIIDYSEDFGSFRSQDYTKNLELIDYSVIEFSNFNYSLFD